MNELFRQPDHEHGDEPISNRSANRHFNDVLSARIARRSVLRGGIGAAVLGLFGTTALSRVAFAQDAATPSGLIGFEPVATSIADTISVPVGYRTQPLASWGTPITGNLPAFAIENGGEDQGNQVGSHHDGMHFFPIDSGRDPWAGSSEDGLLVMNHEYVEPRFMHAELAGTAANAEIVPVLDNGMRDPDQVLKEINGHGVTVVRVRKGADGVWSVVEDDRNRRITSRTPIAIGGPVRGSDLVKTLHSPDGTMTRGTINNCASGVTPWNTYLTAEENWAGYFRNGDAERPREQTRYGVPAEQGRYLWERADGGADEFIRFDASVKGAAATEDYRNEPNTFGWMVEIDPFDPASTPVKRTALGRFAHEGVVFGPAVAGRPVVAYSGDDSTNEYIYKFVSAAAYDPAATTGDILDEGRLYVARFNDDGTGDWLPLVFGEAGLMAENGFASQAEILVNTRTAADFVGATKMDRPEWGAVDPTNGAVYFTLTNNTGREVTDAANPRAANAFGHIIRWREAGDDHSATTFEWDIFVLAGPGEDSRTLAGEPLGQEAIFACPDGLWFDRDGRLWIQTDIGEGAQNRGVMEIFGNNQMLAADPSTGEIRRFLTGPIGQEITGITGTPDGRTLFINVQHPGATTSPEDFAAGAFASHWPDGGSAYPRSSTVVISREDGGVIGT